jgi:hypothetical protein
LCGVFVQCVLSEECCVQAVCPLSRAVSRGCCVLRRLVLPAVGSELAYSYVRFLLFRPGGALGAGSVCPPYRKCGCVPRVWLCPRSRAVSPGASRVPRAVSLGEASLLSGRSSRRGHPSGRTVTTVDATIMYSICAVLSVRGALCAGGVSPSQAVCPRGPVRFLLFGPGAGRWVPAVCVP